MSKVLISIITSSLLLIKNYNFAKQKKRGNKKTNKKMEICCWFCIIFLCSGTNVNEYKIEYNRNRFNNVVMLCRLLKCNWNSNDSNNVFFFLLSLYLINEAHALKSNFNKITKITTYVQQMKKKNYTHTFIYEERKKRWINNFPNTYNWLMMFLLDVYFIFVAVCL